MKTFIVSVANFSGNSEIKNAVLCSDDIRRKTLNACYNIPNYASMTLQEKNAVYDKIKNSLT